MNGEKKEKMKKFTKMLAFMLAIVLVASNVPAMNVYAAETKATEEKALKDAFLVTQETTTKEAKVLKEMVLTVGDKVDFRFIGIPDYKSIPNKKWVSTNTKVATVNGSGVVTAKAPGSTIVTYECEGYKCYPLCIIVKEKEVKTRIVNLSPAKNITSEYFEMGLDEKIDLNFYGVIDWATLKETAECTWTSSNPDVCTVTKNGVVKSKGIGDSRITFTLINNKKVMYVGYTEVFVTGDESAPAAPPTSSTPTPTPTPTPEATPTPTPTPTPEVVLDKFVVEQVSDSSVVMKFETAQEIDASKIDVNQKYLSYTFDVDFEVKDVVKGQKYDTVTLVFDTPLGDTFDYEVIYKNEKQVFKASIGEVKFVKFAYETHFEDEVIKDIAYVSTDVDNAIVKLVPKFFNEKGVDITNVVNVEDYYVDFEIEYDYNYKYSSYYDEIVFNEVTAVPVTMKVQKYSDMYNDKNVLTYRNVVTAIRRPDLHVFYADGAAFDEDLSITTNGTTITAVSDAQANANGYAWNNNKGVTSIVKGDFYKFVGRIYTNRNSEYKTVNNFNDTNDDGYIYYKSSNDNILVVAGDEIMGINLGSASVLTVWRNNLTGKETVIGATVINVTKEAVATTFSLDVKTVNLMTGSQFGEDKGVITLTVKDQYGNIVSLANGVNDISITSSRTDASMPYVTEENGVYKIHVNTTSTSTSTLRVPYTITLDKTYNPSLTSKTTSFNVVTYPLNEKASTWKTESTSNTIDLNVESLVNGVQNPIKKVEVAAYVYNSSGFKIAKLDMVDIATLADVKNGDYTKAYYKFKAPTNAKNYVVTVNSDNNLEIEFNATNSGVVDYATIGSYTVEVKAYKKATNSTATSGAISTLTPVVVNVSNTSKEAAFAGFRFNENGKVSPALSGVTSKTSNTDSKILEAVARALKFTYYPEVQHPDYDMGAVMGEYENDATKSPLCQITEVYWMYIAENRILVKEVTLKLGHTLKDGSVVYTTQVIKGINTYLQNN